MKPKLYSYDLTDWLIAKAPAQKRDESRLLVYDTKTAKITFDIFRHIARYVPAKSLMVLNTASVIPARITLHKQTGGKVVCLFLVNEPEQRQNEMRVMVDRKVTVGDELLYEGVTIGKITSHGEAGIFFISLKLTRKELIHLLNSKGVMPIPLYLRDTKLEEPRIKDRYQTIFAKPKESLGAAAAPTASLHFTNEVFASLKKKHIHQSYISLLVGLGTFAPLTKKHMDENKLHEEWYEILPTTQKELKDASEIIAVGTTVVRALESYGMTKKHIASTDIFIHPPFSFIYVDHLITNFHLPNSSLMMLVEAFLQYKQAKHHLVELYRMAINKDFRFYSFGDSMIIL